MSNERVDGGPAFPTIGSDERVGVWTDNKGLSIRDYFAAKALPGVVAFGLEAKSFDPEAIAEDAYKVADAMLAERRKAVGDLNKNPLSARGGQPSREVRSQPRAQSSDE